MLKRTPKTRFFFFIISDISLIIASVYASFFLRFDFSIPAQYLPNIPYYCGFALLALLPIFYIKKLYHFTWVYVGITDLIKIFQAVTYGFFLLGLLLFLWRNERLAMELPRSIILVNMVLAFFFIGSIRFAKRLFVEAKKTSNNHRGKERKPNLIIIGAGDAAEQLIRTIKQTNDYPFHVIGILDDSGIKQNTTLHNVPVLGKINDLTKIYDKERVRGVIIAIPSASSKEIERVLSLATECGIQYVKTLPSLTELLERRADITDIRDIKVEDLLGRKKNVIDLKLVTELISQKTVLITGAAGSIGFELVKQISKLRPRRLICVDSDETGIFSVLQFLANMPEQNNYFAYVANILNKQKLHTIFQRHSPNIVFHAAAYKHVKLMEQNPEEAVLNNVLGTWNTVSASLESGTKQFVLISTDKAVNPSSVMGMSKRIAEMLILHYNGEMKTSAVRFGNVLGSRGSVVPIFKEQILSGGPVTVTHPDMERYFMTPSESILLVLQAGAIGQGGEIFALDMGNPIKIIHLAETMIKLTGFEPYKDIPIIFTKPLSEEKLFEEIMTDKENMTSTKYKEIFITRNDNSFDKTIFFNKLNKLIELAKTQEIQKIKNMLKEFTAPSNSQLKGQ